MRKGTAAAIPLFPFFAVSLKKISTPILYSIDRFLLSPYGSFRYFFARSRLSP
jgi:hypothetical protein